MDEFVFPGYFVMAIFIAAMNAKALGAMIVYAIGLLAVFPDAEKAHFLSFFVVSAVIMASFRN